MKYMISFVILAAATGCATVPAPHDVLGRVVDAYYVACGRGDATRSAECERIADELNRVIRAYNAAVDAAAEASEESE